MTVTSWCGKWQTRASPPPSPPPSPPSPPPPPCSSHPRKPPGIRPLIPQLSWGQPLVQGWPWTLNLRTLISLALTLTLRLLLPRFTSLRPNPSPNLITSLQWKRLHGAMTLRACSTTPLPPLSTVSTCHENPPCPPGSCPQNLSPISQYLSSQVWSPLQWVVLSGYQRANPHLTPLQPLFPSFSHLVRPLLLVLLLTP